MPSRALGSARRCLHPADSGGPADAEVWEKLANSLGFSSTWHTPFLLMGSHKAHFAGPTGPSDRGHQFAQSCRDKVSSASQVPRQVHYRLQQVPAEGFSSCSLAEGQ